MDNLINESIGKGLTFPIVLEGGKPVLVTGIELIQSSIATIIQWPILNREYLILFGSKVSMSLEEQLNRGMFNSLRYTIEESLTNFEKRIKVISVEVYRKSEETISIYVKYQLIINESEHTLITDL